MNGEHLYRLFVHQLLRLGLPGAIGLVLMAVAGFWVVFVHAPDVQRLDTLQQELVKLEARLAEPESDVPDSPVGRLQAFYEAIPQQDKIPDRLAGIFKLARAQGLALDIGDYTLTHEASGRLDRFQITFPVKGSYPKLREFIFQAIAETPGLALEGIGFKRELIADPVVEARLTFLLFVEKAK